MSKTKRIVLIVTIVAFLVFCVTLYKALFYAATDEIPLPPGSIEAEVNKDASTYPTLLSIPKLNINAEVRDVGITSRGNMGTPDNYDDVGWYRYGTLPGSLGSAVMAGHVDNGLHLSGVFANLKNLEIGDEVFVESEGGGKLRFLVTRINLYDFDAKDTDVFTESDGKFLKLVTCTGSWVSKAKTHDKRLVVTAVLAP